MNSDLLLVVVAGYVVYKIGWVDGWTTVNLFLVLCLVIIGAAAVLRRTPWWKRMRAEREAVKKKQRDDDTAPKP